jgi:predicted ATP-grasp superfamily ATP-dependent carboligase
MDHAQHSVSSQEFKGRKALVLDGESRAALAAIRSLGRAGFEVHVVTASLPAIGTASRFVSKIHLSPAPANRGNDYRLWLRFLVHLLEPDLLLPVTSTSLLHALAIRDTFPSKIIFPFPQTGLIKSVEDKKSLLAIAGALGVRVPETVLIPQASERTNADILAVRSFCYPAILKPNASDTQLGDRVVKLPVVYLTSADEALRALDTYADSSSSDVPLLLQERIIGDGEGVFALCKGGAVRSLFCHHRLLEKPPSGGVSVLSESVPEDQAPVATALSILKRLRWDGVAMIEFKRTAQGEHVLMELNPRLWGSLQLAIDCGRDFPVALYRLFAEGDTTSPAERPYLLYQRLRWPLGTVDHALARARRSPIKTIADILFRNCLFLFSKNTRFDIWRLNDLAPALTELSLYCRSLRNSIFKQQRS